MLLTRYQTAQGQETHPLYEYRWRQWRMNELSYIGGTDYLYPDLTFDWVRPAYGETDAGLEVESQPEPLHLKTFLQPFSREPMWAFEMRRLSAVYRNLTAPVVDALAAFVQSKPALRDAGTTRHLPEMWAEQSGDVDMAGSTMAEFMREGLRGALIYGLVHCIVDWPSVQLGAVRTLGDEKRLGIRPFARWVTSLAVPRWKHDAFGNLVAVEILEPDLREVAEAPWGTRGAPPLARCWYPDHWELRDEPDGELLEERAHAYGRVPMETLYCRRLPGEKMVAITPVDDISRLNQRVFNIDSSIQSLEAAQYPFLAVPGGEKLGRLELGTTDAFAIPAGGGMPGYISPPADNIRVLRESLSELAIQIRARAGLSRGVSEQSIAARSGDAMLIEASERMNIVAALAHEARDFESRFGWLVAAVGGSAAFDGSVRYPESYTMETLKDRIEEATKLVALPIPDAAKYAVLDGLWRSALSGLSEKETEEIEKEIAAEEAAYEAQVVAEAAATAEAVPVPVPEAPITGEEAAESAPPEVENLLAPAA